MIITHCYAYSDMIADLNQYSSDTFTIALKGQGEGSIHLTLSYSQAKSLSEGISTMLSHVRVKEITSSAHGQLAGDMSLNLKLPEDNTENDEEGGEPECQPPSLSVLMETVYLSKIA